MFNVGDIVEITEESDATGMLDFKKGKGYPILEVACQTTDLAEPVKVFYLKIKVRNESGVDSWYTASHFKLKEGTKVEKNECLFKEGQAVWDIIYGKGVVKSYDTLNRPYPVTVVFEDGGYDYYTEDGKLELGDKSRRLFFSEPKIEAATEPVFEPVLKEGDVIIAVDKNGERATLVLTVTDEDEHFVRTVEYGVMGKQRLDFYHLGEKIVFN